MPAAHHSRVRLTHRRPARREACRWDRPLLDHLYTVLLDPDDTWTLFSGTTRIAAADDPHELATAILRDAFPGHTIRDDLVAALADEFPHDGGFVLPADLVVGWSLRWALNQPT